jgi:hypothetical protein
VLSAVIVTLLHPRFPGLVAVSAGVVVEEILVRIMQSDPGAIQGLQMNKTGSVEELLASPVSIAFYLEGGIGWERQELEIGSPKIPIDPLLHDHALFAPAIKEPCGGGLGAWIHGNH